MRADIEDRRTTHFVLACQFVYECSSVLVSRGCAPDARLVRG